LPKNLVAKKERYYTLPQQLQIAFILRRNNQKDVDDDQGAGSRMARITLGQ
jgi:hypothetical protein